MGKGKKKAKEAKEIKRSPRVIIKNPTPPTCMEPENKDTTSMFKRQELSNHGENFIRDMEQRHQINEELSKLRFQDRQERRRTPSQNMQEGVYCNEQLLGLDFNSTVLNFSLAEEASQNQPHEEQ